MPKNANMPSDRPITPTVKLRCLNSDRSTTGWRACSSHTTRKVRHSSAVMPSVTIIGEANQSWSLPLSSMNCSAPTPTTSNTRPITSMGAL